MAGSISAVQAARHLCKRSGWTLSNLELQKMLYLAQMIYMGEHNGERLLEGTFQAWDYGPVLPSIYAQARPFGSGPVRDVFRSGAGAVEVGRASTLDKVYDQLSTKTAGQLVAITHWKDGAWAKNYVPGTKSIPIPDEDILNEYRARASRQRG